MAELAKEIIKEFAMEIADLKRDVNSWHGMYQDLYTRHQDLLVDRKEQEQHLNVGPSYEEMENALLTEQELNQNLDKEIARLTAILKERDAEIAKLRLMVPEIKPMQKDEHPEPYVFDECDKVVVGGMFFHEPNAVYIGKVLVVKDTHVRVEISEGQRQGEYNIPYDYLAPLVEENK